MPSGVYVRTQQNIDNVARAAFERLQNPVLRAKMKAGREEYWKQHRLECRLCKVCGLSELETKFASSSRHWVCAKCRRAAAAEKSRHNISNGLCRCGKGVPLPGVKACSFCDVRQKKRRRQIKLDVMKAYGGKCMCPGGCDVTEVDFLTIDHINGDGAEHRKRTGLMGGNMYFWLKRNSYPAGFRPLCWNCNVSRSQFEGCPHERKNLGEVMPCLSETVN